MTPKRIDYGEQNQDASLLLEQHGITRDRISEDARVRTVEYLESVLKRGKADARWEFVLDGVTVVGKGWDEAGHFLAHFN